MFLIASSEKWRGLSTEYPLGPYGYPHPHRGHCQTLPMPTLTGWSRVLLDGAIITRPTRRVKAHMGTKKFWRPKPLCDNGIEPWQWDVFIDAPHLMRCRVEGRG